MGDQGLVFPLPAFKVPPGFFQHGPLLVPVPQELLLALFVALTLGTLLLSHRFQQLVEIGDLMTCLWLFLGERSE